MAGTALNYRGEDISVDSPEVWGQLAIPGAGANMTLHTDGTPESVANPSAFHYGYTAEGVEYSITPSVIKHRADQTAYPIAVRLDQADMMLAGALLAVQDMDVVKNLLLGLATYSTASGYKRNQIDVGTVTYQSVAAIQRTFASATYFTVFHIYRTLNEAGMKWSAGRNKRSETPFTFSAVAISDRAAGDRVGNYWKTIA
jgi:hypothetical protein